MKIIYKLSIGFAATITLITLFSIFTTRAIQKEVREVEDFHNSDLYLVQNNAMKMTKAVEESFAYI